MIALRKGLPPLPERIKTLALDERGYPVPYFVAYIDGKPDFRCIDPEKWKKCVQHDRCWICGELLGKYRTFVLGPKSAEHRITSELPSHYECAKFAVTACPFIVLPDARHRPHPSEDKAVIIPGVPYHNPGRMCMWTTSQLPTELLNGGVSGVLIRPGEPSEVVWYEKGEAIK